MHAELALCKDYDFASLKYDRIGTCNFSYICAGRRIQFQLNSRAEIRSCRALLPTVARTLIMRSICGKFV